MDDHVVNLLTTLRLSIEFSFSFLRSSDKTLSETTETYFKEIPMTDMICFCFSLMIMAL
jgi:hypothetical protein